MSALNYLWIFLILLSLQPLLQRQLLAAQRRRSLGRLAPLRSSRRRRAA